MTAASFGSLFPDSFRADFSERAIRPGSVLRIHVDTTNPPKQKRLVILAMGNDEAVVGYLFINSEINPNLFRTPALKALHLPLDKDRHGFLDHDSYLDCSKIFKVDMEQLRQAIASEPGQHIGCMDGETFETAIGIVRAAPTISPRDKDFFAIR